MVKRKDQEYEDGAAKKRKEIVSLANGGSDLESNDEDDSEDELVGRKALLKEHIPTEQKQAGKYKQRVLIITSRGITHRFRHLMNDLHVLMPHSKKDAKLDSKAHLEDLNELAELNNCNNCLYFEVRKHQDMYMWMSRTPNGPSVKFMVRNVHTMDELKMTGNCLKGSRPLLSFDATFDGEPHLQLLKEMFQQVYATPRTSRKIKPFIDRVMSFSILDNKVWVRNYQIIESLADEPNKKKSSLVEIGPRFVLEIMRIFDGSFRGSTLYENPDFVTPNNVRRALKGKASIKHQKRIDDKQKREVKLKTSTIAQDPLDSVFK
ncbi:Ribosome biogenesis protein BRX1 [Boothiomyces sp. JEL0866]|nr:Ribosome biogenesis protein BRX1 [Boothiomyces sp. JEL0866]